MYSDQTQPSPFQNRPEETKHVHLLIVGGGLAGSLLAWNAEMRGLSFRIVDPVPSMNASLAAAGVLNPVTGKRLVKSWNVDTLLPAARATYRRIEQICGGEYYFDREILRVIQTSEERRQWEKRMSQPDYASFLGELLPPGSAGYGWDDPLGSFRIKGVGNLLIPPMMETLRNRYKLDGSWIVDLVRHEEIRVLPDAIQWRNLAADYLIFCEGHAGKQNPWFGHLPFNPAKGEVIEVEGIRIPANPIVHKQKWVLSLAENRVITGSTWGWNPDNENTTSQGKTAVYRGLCEMMPKAEGLPIVAHRAAIRPCTKDRQPFLGLHPKHRRLGLFNGFGSKGVLLIPLLANHFLDHLLGGIPLIPEVDIQRAWVSENSDGLPIRP